jgi:hypothetical protein
MQDNSMIGEHSKTNHLLALVFSGGFYSAIVAPLSGLVFMQISAGGIDFSNFLPVLAFGAIWYAPVAFVIGAVAAIIVAVLGQRTPSTLHTTLKGTLVGGLAGALFGIPGICAGMLTGFTYSLLFRTLLRPLPEAAPPA